MKKNLLIPCLALILSNAAIAGDNKDCSYNCFNTTIISMETTEDGCYNYTLSVSYSDDCTYALSHLAVETGCGRVTSLSNSENWKQEIGLTDPATGISGFKIDEISEFGKSGTKSFTIDVTICPDNTSCANSLSCWAPVVAYKAGQCVAYDSISYQCNKLDASLSAENPTCSDSNDGSITIEIEEGLAPFSYSWSTGDTTKNLTGIPGGNYSVIILDASGETLNLSTELAAPSRIGFNYEISNASCGGVNNGAISVDATGGTAPYTYSWSDGSTGSTISNLAPGQYKVTATDAAGCSKSQSFLLESINKLNIQAQITKSGCTENTGAIDLLVSGSSGNYTYQWLDGATTEDREQLSSGFYSVTVTDENGCQSSRTFSVKTNNTLAVNGTIIPTGCPDDNSGGVNVSVSGATGDLSYFWSTGDTTANLANAGTGRYELKVVDRSGCSISKSFYVFGESIAVESSVNHPSCYEGADGSISLTSDEGITVEWSNGATTAEISGLTEGLYTATISNAEGCSTTLSYYINAPDGLSLSYFIENETCESTGNTASLTVEGGNAPYEVVWNDGGTGAVRENISAGTYNVLITDSKGCQISREVIVEAPASDCPDSADTGEEATDEEASDENTSESDQSEEDTTGTTDEPEDSSGNTQSSGDSDDSGNDNPSGDNIDAESTDESTSGENNPVEEENTVNVEEINYKTPAKGDISCGDPYDVNITLSETGNCQKYTADIIYSGEQSFGLSHAVISTTCGEINGIYTDNGIFETGEDPSTGLQGLKVDEIKKFGEGNMEERLNFEFDLCNTDCNNSGSVTFVIGYKFGQCIDYDTVTVEVPQGRLSSIAYPNPASGKINFDYEIPANESIQVELYSKYGLQVKSKTFKAGETLQLDINDLPNEIYTYRLISKKNVANGKIIVVNN